MAGQPTTGITIALAAASVLTFSVAARQVPQPQPVPLQKNIRLIAHDDLNGKGDGGEGMAIQQLSGRRILYLAHSGTEACLSIVDVTNTSRPALLAQLPSPNPGVVRCN